MPPPQYKDFGKTGKELFSKGFPNNFEFTAESTIAKQAGEKAEQGEVVITQKTKITRNDAGDLSGNFNPKWAVKSAGATLSTTIHTSKKLEIEATLADKGLKGLKSILKVVAPQFDAVGKDRDSQSIRAELEYAQDVFVVGLGVDVLNPKPSASLSGVVNRERWSLGGEAAYSLGSAPDLQSLAVAVGYAGAGWSGVFSRKAAEGATQKVSYGANIYQKVDENLELGAEVSHAVGDKNVPNLAFGGKFTGYKSDVKAKVGTNGRIGIAYTQDLNYFSRVTLGADVNSADSKDTKLGLSLSIHD